MGSGKMCQWFIGIIPFGMKIDIDNVNIWGTSL
jgi:hypothetical protein